MYNRISCASIRSNLKKELLETLETIPSEVRVDINSTLFILMIDPKPDDYLYLKAIQRIAHELGVVLVERTISTSDEAFLITTENLIFEAVKSNFCILVMCDKGIRELHTFRRIMAMVPPNLDVDGISPVTALDDNIPATTMATMLTALEINFKEDIKYTHSVVIGRGSVGRSIANGLLYLNSSVTLVHSKTPEWVLNELLEEANIIVTAVGKPHIFDYRTFTGGTHDKLVIDVGVSKDEKDNVCGDIRYPLDENHHEILGNSDDMNLGQRVYNYTTITGGIGLLTPVCLMINVLDNCYSQYGWTNFSKFTDLS